MILCKILVVLCSQITREDLFMTLTGVFQNIKDLASRLCCRCITWSRIDCGFLDIWGFCKKGEHNYWITSARALTVFFFCFVPPSHTSYLDLVEYGFSVNRSSSLVEKNHQLLISSAHLTLCYQICGLSKGRLVYLKVHVFELMQPE